MDYQSIIDTLQATRNNLELIKESVMDVIDICATEDAALAIVIDRLQAASKGIPA